MKKILLFTLLTVSAISSFGLWYEPVKTKIYPDNFQKASNFGKDIHLGDSMLIISDPDYTEIQSSATVAPSCSTGFGAMFMYIKQSGNWVFKQRILPDAQSANPVRFAKNFSYKNRILVVSADNQIPPGLTHHSGCFYVYIFANNQFTRIAKVENPKAGFWNFSRDGVATNGKYIACFDAYNKILHTYTVNAGVVSKLFESNLAAEKVVGITTNNTIILKNGNNFRFIKISGSGISEISNDALTVSSSQIYDDCIAVDGNTMVAEVYGTTPGGSKTGYIKVVQVGTDRIESVYNINFPRILAYAPASTTTDNRNISDIWLSEYSGIAVSFRKNEPGFINRVVKLNYTGGKYHIADVLQQPNDAVTSSFWGAAVAFSSTEMFVGDYMDKTNLKSGTTWCNDQPASGAVNIYRMNIPVTKLPTGDRIITTPFTEQYDGTGEVVALSGNYGLIAHPSSDDLEDNSGAVSLIKNTGGQWNYIKKFYPESPKVLDLFGRGLSISSKFAAIGSKDQAVVYPVLASDGVAIENQLYPSAFTCPELKDNGFGMYVATDGDYLAISAYLDNEKGHAAGAVYIYNWTGSYWKYIQKLTPDLNQTYQLFGNSISMKGNYLVIGAYGEDNSYGTDAGAAYVYKLESGLFKKVQKLYPSWYGIQQRAGKLVSLSSDYLLVTADAKPGEPNNGYIMHFRLQSGSWRKTLTSSKVGPESMYGNDCAVDGAHVVTSDRYGMITSTDPVNTNNNGYFKLPETNIYRKFAIAISNSNVLIGDYHNNGTRSGLVYLKNSWSKTVPRLDETETTVEPVSEAQENLVYPNPASGNFINLVNEEEVQKIDSYSVTGEYTGELKNTAGQVDISNLKPGIYLLQLQTSGGTKVVKLNIY